MRLTLPIVARLRSLVAFSVWAGSICLAWWLYHQSVGVSAGVAVAQVRQYRVAPTQLGQLSLLDVKEGQRVAANQLIAQLRVLNGAKSQPDAPPMLLRAAVDSYVSAIHARPGDVIHAGDPIVTLVEVQPREAAAYLDERRGFPLTAGTKVVARRRATPMQQWEGTVTNVGASVEQLPQRLWTHPNMPAWGRAMYVSLPPEAALDPGELLDIALPPSPKDSLAGWIRLSNAQAAGASSR